jgi:hypothetical protein
MRAVQLFSGQRRDASSEDLLVRSAPIRLFALEVCTQSRKDCQWLGDVYFYGFAAFAMSFGCNTWIPGYRAKSGRLKVRRFLIP